MHPVHLRPKDLVLLPGLEPGQLPGLNRTTLPICPQERDFQSLVVPVGIEPDTSPANQAGVLPLNEGTMEICTMNKPSEC